MTQKEPREDDAFYALRTKKWPEEFEKYSDRYEGGSAVKLANYAGWRAQDDGMQTTRCP